MVVTSNLFAQVKEKQTQTHRYESQRKHSRHPNFQIHKEFLSQTKCVLFGALAHPPKGKGPKCSATGPRAATGKKSNAPTIRIVPINKTPNVKVSSRRVPKPKGADFLAPR